MLPCFPYENYGNYENDENSALRVFFRSQCRANEPQDDDVDLERHDKLARPRVPVFLFFPLTSRNPRTSPCAVKREPLPIRMRSIDLNAGLVVWHGGHARVDTALEPRHVDRRVEVARDDPDVCVFAQERPAPLELIELQVRRILRVQVYVHHVERRPATMAPSAPSAPVAQLAQSFGRKRRSV